MTDSILEGKLDPPAKILVVDDSHLNRCFVENTFTEPEYIVISACDATEGLAKAKEERPELILMDVMMPEINGFTATERLKADPETQDIPVIFITALDAVRDKLRAFEVGAVDFVTKPFNHKELIARVYTNIALRRSIAEREQMLKNVMEGKRNTAIAKVAAGVSHNFNNMLSVSAGNMMLLESIAGPHFDDITTGAYNDVVASLKRMQAMVKQFLVLSNRSNEVQGGVPVPADESLHALIAAILDDLPNSAGSKVKNAIPKDSLIFIDKLHISEAFALILFEVQETSGGKAQCTVALGEDPEAGVVECEIRVKDFPVCSELHDTIFEPFSMPIANVGTGLSFAVARHIVELNHCAIKAKFPSDSEVTFVIELPAPQD